MNAIRRPMSSLCSVALGVALVLAAGAAPAAPAVLGFEPSAGSFLCDETWAVDVVIDAAATDLHGFSLVMTYDADVVAPVSVTAGDLLDGAACPYFLDWLDPAEPDSIAVDAATLGCSVDGPGALVHIVFTGVTNGTSPLACQDVRLRDGENAPIPFTCEPATVTYDCPIATETPLWGAVKACYR